MKSSITAHVPNADELTRQYIIYDGTLYKIFSENIRKKTFTFHRVPLTDRKDKNFFIDIDKITALTTLLTEKEASSKFPAKFL